MSDHMKEYLIVDKETGEVVDERKLRKIPKDKKPSGTAKAAVAVIAAACVIIVFCLIWITSALTRAPLSERSSPILSVATGPSLTFGLIPAPAPSPTTSPVPTPAPTPAPSPVPIYNGEIVHEPLSERLAPLTVEVSDDADYYIVLEPTCDDFLDSARRASNRMSFYVSAGSSVEIDVPLEDYEIYYATGHTWYGPELKFGDNTRLYKCDDTFYFYFDGQYYNGWTLTLYAVLDGNLDTTQVSESDFPDF